MVFLKYKFSKLTNWQITVKIDKNRVSIIPIRLITNMYCLAYYKRNSNNVRFFIIKRNVYAKLEKSDKD